MEASACLFLSERGQLCNFNYIPQDTILDIIGPAPVGETDLTGGRGLVRIGANYQEAKPLSKEGTTIAVIEVARGGGPYRGIGRMEAIMSQKLDFNDWSGRNKTK